MLVIVGLWLLSRWGTNPINSLALIRHAEIAEGVVLDTYEYWGTNDNGDDTTSHALLYTFHAPDGSEYKKWSGAMWGDIPEEYKQLPAPTEVEYLPSDPSVNRIHGEGAQSILLWVFRDIFANILLFICLCLPGALIAFNAVENIKIAKELSEKWANEGNVDQTSSASSPSTDKDTSPQGARHQNRKKQKRRR